MGIDMDKLDWQGNSYQMYQAILRGVPIFFRSKVKTQIINWIAKNSLHTITESLVFKAVDQIAPPDIAKRITSELRKMTTTLP